MTTRGMNNKRPGVETPGPLSLQGKEGTAKTGFISAVLVPFSDTIPGQDAQLQ